MGLEVGWHLRFSRDEEIEFLVDQSAKAQAEQAVYTASGWSMESADEGDHARVRYARRQAGAPA